MVNSWGMHSAEHPTVITLGETMVLVTPVESEPLETAPVFHLDVGGAESNVASHLAALGHHAAWVGQFGNDALGRRAARQIGEHNVDTRWVTIDDSAPTGVYFKDPGNGVLYFRRGSAASRMGPDTVASVPLEDAAIVHLSGITPALSDSCAALVDAVLKRMQDADGQVSFDVNFRSGLWDVATAAPVLLDIARRADLVFVGLDEAHTLWGATSPDDVRTLISAPTLIVKDGDIGATEYDRDGSVFVEAIPSTVVEAVGAGDAFAAGYLGALLADESSSERLRAGHERAVLVLQSTLDVPLAADGERSRS